MLKSAVHGIPQEQRQELSDTVCSIAAKSDTEDDLASSMQQAVQESMTEADVSKTPVIES